MRQEEGLDVHLRALRQAAESDDWNGCCAAARALLRRMPRQEAEELARRQLERRLPAFERHQPGVTWPRQLVEALGPGRPAGELPRKWPGGDEDFPGPGANGFLSGLEELWLAQRLQQDDPKRIEACVSALQSAISAEQNEAWGARHPEQWRHWHEVVGRGDWDAACSRIQDARWTAPESVRIRREGWHEVADRLAEALGLPPGR